MAEFGIETYRPNGSVAITGANKAGIFIEVLRLPYGNASNKVYPDIPAGSLYYLLAWGTDSHRITVDSDGAGRARVTWIGSGGVSWNDTYLLIFARNVTHSDSFGAVIQASNGDLLADLTYPVPRYLFKMTTTSVSAIPSVSARHLYKIGYTLPSNMETATNKLILFQIPDSTTDDSWWSCESFIPAGSSFPLGTTIPAITMYAWGPSQLQYIPTVYVYALDGGVPSSGSSYGVQLYSRSGSLVFDSGNENICVKEIASIYPNDNGGAPVSYNLSNIPTNCAIAAPFFDYDYYNYPHDTVERYLGMVQRKGQKLSYQNMLVQGTVGAGANATYLSIEGNIRGGGAILMDNSQLT